MAEHKTELFAVESQELAELYKALSHPARIEILQFLSQRAVCYSGNIADEIPLGRTTVNQHLRELKRVGLIQGIVQGKKTNYCINTDLLKRFRELTNTFLLGIDIVNPNEQACKPDNNTKP